MSTTISHSCTETHPLPQELALHDSQSVDDTMMLLHRKCVPQDLVYDDSTNNDEIIINSNTCCIQSRYTLSRDLLNTQVANQVITNSNQSTTQSKGEKNTLSSPVYAPYYFNSLKLYKSLLSSLHQSHIFTSLVIIAIITLTKVFIGSFGHSGYNTPPMYGDFEAQRHWMEITTQTPLREWYIQTPSNDLQYWGLDYPPFSALWAYLTGVIAEWYSPRLVELVKSRGLEDSETRQFMRWSVIIGDLIFLVPSTFLLVNEIIKIYTKHFESKSDQKDVNGKITALKTINETNSFNYFTLITTLLFQPLLLLIDHGHFQYNGLCFALLFLSITLTLQHRFKLVAVVFPLCCFFKQTGLYFALPLFTYIVSVLLYPTNDNTKSDDANNANEKQKKQCQSNSFRLTFSALFTFLLLGLIAATTFGLCFVPFLTSAIRNPELEIQPIVEVTRTRPLVGYQSIYQDVSASFCNNYFSKIPFLPHHHCGTVTDFISDPVITAAHKIRPYVGSVVTKLSLSPLTSATTRAPRDSLISQVQLLFQHFTTTTVHSLTSLQSPMENPESIIIGIQTIIQQSREFFNILYNHIITPHILPLIKPTIFPIIGRMFPFKRGLFEDKVASFWCISNIIIKWHDKFPIQHLTKLSTLSTLVLMIPSLLSLFFTPIATKIKNIKESKYISECRQQKQLQLLHCLVVCAFAFFLCSMQIHEKTVMYALLPLALLSIQYSTLYYIVAIVANTTCMFLLVRDGQTIPYFILQTIFVIISILSVFSSQQQDENDNKSNIGLFIPKVAMLLFAIFPVIVAYAKWFIPPPTHLPYLIELLTMVVGFITFFGTLVFLTIQQFRI